MAIRLPQSKAALPELQRSKYQVPVEQIIAAQGQNPLAQGIASASQVLGAALQRRALLRQQAAEVDAIASVAGQQAPTHTPGLTPEVYEKGLTAKAALLNAQRDKGTWADVGLDPVSKKLVQKRADTGEIRYVDNPSQSQLLPVTRNPADPANETFKREAGIEKMFAPIEKRLSPDEASARIVYGRSADVKRRATNALGLMDANGGKMTKAEANALSTDMSGILAGSSGGVGEGMTEMHGYKTAFGDLQNLRQYLSGSPQEYITPEIAQRIRNNFQSLNEIADSSIKNTQARILYNNQHLRKLDAERYGRLFETSGIAPEEIVKGTYVPRGKSTPAPQGGLSPAAQALINKHR